jgi:hypothetical protein
METSSGSPDGPDVTVFDAVTEQFRPEERLKKGVFIDAVPRNQNLRRGRFLLLIVGDGIREGVESYDRKFLRHPGQEHRDEAIEKARATDVKQKKPRTRVVHGSAACGFASQTESRTLLRAPGPPAEPSAVLLCA